MMRIPIKNNGKIIGAIGKTLFKDMVIAKVFAKKLIQLENDLEYYKEEFRKNSRFGLLLRRYYWGKCISNESQRVGCSGSQHFIDRFDYR